MAHIHNTLKKIFMFELTPRKKNKLTTPSLFAERNQTYLFLYMVQGSNKQMRELNTEGELH